MCPMDERIMSIMMALCVWRQKEKRIKSKRMWLWLGAISGAIIIIIITSRNGAFDAGDEFAWSIETTIECVLFFANLFLALRNSRLAVQFRYQPPPPPLASSESLSWSLTIAFCFVSATVMFTCVYIICAKYNNHTAATVALVAPIYARGFNCAS